MEYDLLNCQGLAQEDVTESNHSRHGKGYNFDSNFSTSHPRRPPSRAPGANEEGKRKRRKRVPEALGAPLRPSHGAPVEHRSLFVPVSSNMKGDFSEQNILGWCRKLISTIVQDRGKIFSRHMDLCDRR